MSDLDSFLAAIREEPDADAPRLVFADFLEEQNDPRGELIRIQCELAGWVDDLPRRRDLQQREQELIRRHQRAWLRALARLPGSRWRIDRGLIDLTTQRALPGRSNPWVQTLRLRGEQSGISEVDAALTPARLRRLHTLELAGVRFELRWEYYQTLAKILSRCERAGVQHVRLVMHQPFDFRELSKHPGWPWPRLRSIEWAGLLEGMEYDKSLQTEARWFKAYLPSPPRAAGGWLTNSIGMRFRRIPAGTFEMGSPKTESGHDNDEIQHLVTLSRPFYLGIYPVTQGEFERVCGTNPSHYQADLGGTPRHPVEQVTWDEAVAFCEQLSRTPAELQAGRTYRLPTEAEWEHACRAGTTTRFSFGDEWTPSLANLLHTCQHTTPVGCFPANAFGLYDMHGQVREWCQDWYDRNYYGESPAVDPPGPEGGESRVLRGGSWDISSELYARSAYRVYYRPEGRLVGIGFRVVCEVQPIEASRHS